MNIDNSMSANSLVVVVADIVIVKFVLGDVEAQFLLHVDAENSENNKASYDNPQPAKAIQWVLDSSKAVDSASEEKATNDGCHVDKDAISIEARNCTKKESEESENDIESVWVVVGKICDARDHPEDHAQQEA